MNNETRKDQNTMKKLVGSVAAAGVALGGLAVIAPDADATAYGATCELYLNTDAPNGDPHWQKTQGQTSMGGLFDIPVYVSSISMANTGGLSAPFAPMSSASMAAPGPAAGKVICVVGRHAAIINGTPGSDTIYGGAGNETINGGAGDDVIFGNGGDDVIIGKAGHDSIDGGAGNDILFGHGGRNSAVSEGTAAQEGRDTLTGGAGNDLLRGDRGDDVLNGKAGDDCLLGGKGNDEVYGWDGDDTIGGGSGADYLAGNDNNDYIFGGKGNDTLRGNDGLDQVWGDSDLFDIGIEMTINKTAGNLEFGPTSWTTINGRVHVNAGATYTLATPTGVASVITMSKVTLAPVPNLFLDNMSTGNLLVGKNYITGWSAQPTASAPLIDLNVQMSMTTAISIAAPMSARAVLKANTLATSGLAESQIFTMPLTLLGLTAMSSFNFVKPYLVGDPLSTSANIRGPLYVPPNKYDSVNSSNQGGIAVPMATAEVQKLFRGDIDLPKKQLHQHGLVMTVAPPIPPGGPAPAHQSTVVVPGGYASYAVTSDVAVIPGDPITYGAAPAATVWDGAFYLATPLTIQTAPLLPERAHKHASSIGVVPGSAINYQIQSSSGAALFTQAATLVSTVVEVTHISSLLLTMVAAGTVPAPLLEVGDTYLIATRPTISGVSLINHVAEVLTTIGKEAPHFRNGHLEVAACNLDGARMMNDVGNKDIPSHAFSGVSLRGLAGMHQSMVAASSQGDLEVALINNTLPGAPGPSGAFIDWPIGAPLAGYDDDIRGGDADDLLYGEAGSDTVWGDHGDDTIFGEGDGAAYLLAEAAFNLSNTPANASVGGVPTRAMGNKRKLPAGTEAQYPGAAGNDSLSGNLDDDSIEGGPGNDNMYGGPDDDHLIGGAGADSADGGHHWDACEPGGGFVSNCEIVL